jgi:peptidoglycan/xylan/chitin deacetylase (PgdA/CDA1 family)
MITGRVKSLLCETVYHSGLMGITAALTEPRRRPPSDGRFQILIYHRVGSDGDDFVPAISPEGFARHMRVLRQHFLPMSLTDVLTAAERREVPARAVVVTFDDGYRDVLTHAVPVLRRFDIPATLYVATAFMEDGASMWNDRIGCALRTTRCPQLEALDGLEPLPLQTPAERHAALRRVLHTLKRRPPAERDAREIRRHGLEVGAHTVHHPILSALAPETAWSEIVGSKRAIEAQLQAPVQHFAYPNGTADDFDDTTRAQVARAGFASAVSTLFGVNSAATNRYALHRGGPWEEDTAAFNVKLWWYRWTGQRPNHSSARRADRVSPVVGDRDSAHDPTR